MKVGDRASVQQPPLREVARYRVFSAWRHLSGALLLEDTLWEHFLAQGAPDAGEESDFVIYEVAALKLAIWCIGLIAPVPCHCPPFLLHYAVVGL